MTAYPRFKLHDESLPQELIRTFPFVHAPYLSCPFGDRIGPYWLKQWKYLDAWSFGAYAARNLPECDIYVGLSGSSLRAGKKAKKRGARYVCDRGSSHIRVQDQILREEHARWGLPYAGIDPRMMDAEESEYAEADCITVPSHFANRSFLSQGVAPEKIRLLPYGVDLSKSSDQREVRYLVRGRDEPTKGDPLFGVSQRGSIIWRKPFSGSIIQPRR
jgi:starch synthase